MNQALEKWLRKLVSQPMPALKINCDLLKRQLGDQRSSLDQMALVIETDPGLSLSVLRHINKIRSKGKGEEINNARHALIMMGVEQFKQQLPNLPTDESLSSEQRHNLQHISIFALHTAFQARSLGEMRRDMDVDELYSAALLHHLGEMLLTLHAPDEIERVNTLVGANNLTEEDAQQQVFGFQYRELTHELARSWHLPQLLRESVQPSDSPYGERGITIQLAAKLAHHSRHGWYSRTMHEYLEHISEYLKVDISELSTRVHQTAVVAAQSSIVYEGVHPASMLLLPAHDPAIEDDTVIEEAHIEHLEHTEHDQCLTPQPAYLQKIVNKLKSAEGHLSSQQIIHLTVDGIHHGLGMNRVAFAIPNKQGNQLLGNTVLTSNDNDSQFKHFSVELTEHNLFGRLLEKSTALWLDENNRRKYFPLIPTNFHKLIDNDRFFVMSLFVREKPIGLFYADRGGKECLLDEESYQRFKKLIQLAATILARVQKK